MADEQDSAVATAGKRKYRKLNIERLPGETDDDYAARIREARLVRRREADRIRYREPKRKAELRASVVKCRSSKPQRAAEGVATARDVCG